MALPSLTTERLLLRPRQPADIDAVLAMDSEPAVMRFIGDGRLPDPATHRAELSERFSREPGPGLGYWSAFPLPAEDPFLGWLALFPLPGHDHIELGYRFRAAAWGQGYATEGGRAVLDYAFGTLGLAEVTAVVKSGNLASRKVLAKLGFRHDGQREAYGEALEFYRRKP